MGNAHDQDAIDDVLQDALVQTQLPPSSVPSGIINAAVLYGDTYNLVRAAENADVRVVYAHFQSYGGVDDIIIRDVIPGFDLLCANMPTGEWEDALDLTLKFLRARSPVAFLLVTPGVAGTLPTIRERVEPLGYRTDVHAYGEWTFIVGALDNADAMETVLWEIADTVHEWNGE